MPPLRSSQTAPLRGLCQPSLKHLCPRHHPPCHPLRLPPGTSQSSQFCLFTGPVSGEVSSWQAGTCRPGSEASRHGPPHTLADRGHPTSLFPHIGHRPSCWAGGGPLVGRFHCAGRGPSAACSSLAPVTGAGDASQAGFSGLRLKPHVARGCYVTLFREGPPFPASQPVSRQLLVWEIRSARLWGRCRGSRGGGHRAGPEPGLQEAAPAGRGVLRPAVVRTASLGPPYLEARPARPGLGSSPAPPPPPGLRLRPLSRV